MENNRIIENIKRKAQMKIAISNFEKEEENMNVPKKNILKFVATFIISIGVTSGIVFGGISAYEKIWKEPQEYKFQKDITQKDYENCISEEEAKNIGISYLTQIGYINNDNMNSIKLTQEKTTETIIWDLNVGKLSMTIDGLTGKIRSINIPSWANDLSKAKGITVEEAQRTAKELLGKYKTENTNGEYELLSLKGNNEKPENSYIWYAEFYKMYDGLVNPKERVLIGFIPTINELYCLEITDIPYENNEQIITKDEAIKIALEKDKQFEDNSKIKNIIAQIKIEPMNSSIYLRDKYGKEYESGNLNKERISENSYKIKDDVVYYKTEERVRKVWRVNLEYDVSINSEDLRYYTYYIDATTGEIIGGELETYLTREDNLINDEHNLVKRN